ncbi:MAG TPA: site-specific integrase [Candidatus Acidoferrum sp.]|jgi:integrase/recombinase XerD|nr:site-specific integrase [Candidatus Acidoferrum sp.]
MVRQPITDAEAAWETQKALQRFFKNPSGPFPPIKSSPPRNPREGFKVITIHTRQKQNGKWRYERVKEGRGHKLANSVGPFYLRYSHDGRQLLSAPIATLPEAQAEVKRIRAASEIKAKGLTVAELDEINNANRLSIKTAIQNFLELKKNKEPKTRDAYRLHLSGFLESAKVRFLDEVTADTMRAYDKRMADEGYADKTRRNRLMTVVFMLKKNKIENPLPGDELPTVNEEAAIAYSSAQLKKLFAVMDEEDTLRYQFFLGTGCREREVTFAAWDDIDFEEGVYNVRRKPDVGFNLKNHQNRKTPLPTSVLKALQKRSKTTKSRWIFTNDDGQPETHFLRRLKTIALRAGLNCGRCKTTIKKDGKPLEGSCKTAPVCEQWYLHRLRKTAATRWHEKGIPARTIQVWLAHKSLEVTQIYLGETGVKSPRKQPTAQARP